MLLAAMAAHAMAGRKRQALQAADEARALYRARGDRAGLARLDANLGSFHHRQDEHERAIAPYRRARRYFLEHGLRADAAGMALNLANVMSQLDDYDGAERLYLEALDESRANGLEVQAAQADYNLAYLRFLQGRYREALEGLDRAERVYRSLDHPILVGLCHLDRAEVLLQLGLLPEAETEAEAAIASFERLRMPYESAKAYLFHALARHGRGFRQGIDQDLARARARFVAIGNRALAAVVDLQLARIALGDGDRTTALRVSRSALTFFSRSGFPVRAATALELVARAEETGANQRTELRLVRAARLTARHDARLAEARIRLALAQLHRRRGSPQRALAEVDRALDRLERLHATAPAQSWEEALAGEREQAVRMAVTLCLELAERDLPGAVGRAFLYAERGRARSMLERVLDLELGDAPATDPAGRDLAARVARLQRELGWRRHSLLTTPRRGKSRARALRLTGQVRALEPRLARLRVRLGREHPAYAAFGEGVLSSPEEVRQGLPSDTALIEFVVGEVETVRFVIDREGPRAQRLPIGRSALREAIRALQFQMNRFELGGDYVRRHALLLRQAVERRLTHLGRLLCAGLEDEVASRQWIVAPHDVLHYVPFHALRAGGGWLLDRHEVTVVPSASALLRCLRPGTGTGVGAAVFALPDPSLPAVLPEAQAVAAILPDSRLHVGAEATRAAFREAAGRVRFLHLSTHGLFRPDNPMASALRLHDGWLTIADLARLRLQADLVVLSACHAGLDRIFSGDEQMGLGRALLYGGARTLLTTLWAVGDQAMGAWMADFYRALGKGERPATAHRSASLAARERDPHPYAWAPCVLTGKP